MRKLICAALGAMLALLLLSMAAAEGEFNYTIQEDGVYITGYKGKESIVTIPDEIEGQPVVSVSIQENVYLAELTLPSHPVVLPEIAFNGCSSLVKINGLENVCALGSDAFAGTSLRELVFSDTLDQVDVYGLYSNAFSITIPDDISFDLYPVQGPRMEEIHLIRGSGEATLTLVDGVLFSADQTKLIYYPPGRNALEYRIPETTRELCGESFRQIGTRLLVVYIPDSVERFGWNVFNNHQGNRPDVYVYRDSAAEAYFSSPEGEWDLRNDVNLFYMDEAEEPLDEMLERIVRECTAGLTGDYERALALHDWILEHNEYDYSYTYVSALDVFRHGKSVCAGYQDAYSVLLDVAGIPNFRTGNFEHGFNAVQIDGKWCYVDCTWDDNGGSALEQHRYFGLDNNMRYLTYGAEFGMFSHDTPTALKDATYRNHYWVRAGYTDAACAEIAGRIQAQLDAGQTRFEVEGSFEGHYGLMLLSAILNDRQWTVDGAQIQLSCYPLDAGKLRCAVIPPDEETGSGDFGISCLSDGIEIISYTGEDDSVTVPAQINGFPVVSIGNAAFAGNYRIREIVLPDSVREIKGNAFKNMPQLNSINMPESLEIIEGYAFNYCHSLEMDLVFPADLRHIAPCCFESSGIRSARIPSGVAIGDTAFAECSNLKEVSFYASGRDGGTRIGSSAFSGCERLTVMELPDDLSFLGGTVFFRTGIRALKLPATLSYVGVSPIGGCSSLTSCSVDPANPYFRMYGEYLCSYDGTHLYSAIANASNAYVIPSRVKTIGGYAFAAMENVERVVVHGGIETIPEYCFAWCKNLRRLVLEEGVKEIQGNALSDMGCLTDFDLPDSIVKLDSYWGYGSSELEKMTIPSGITDFPAASFRVRHLWVHENVRHIDEYSWSAEFVHGVSGTYAEEFAAIIGASFIPVQRVYLGTCTLCGENITVTEDCQMLRLPEALTEVGEDAFRGITADAVILPEGCIRLADGAFADCRNLKYIVLPEGCQIAEGALAGSSVEHIIHK